MEIIIQSLHFIVREELDSFIKTKLDKLSHSYERIESANVVLKIEKAESSDDKICEIRLAVPGNDLFAKKHALNFEEAVAKAIDALHEQIGKMKKKQEGHHTPGSETIRALSEE